jgi:hypothetical protein
MGRSQGRSGATVRDVEWHELASGVRREVLALAKSGQRHPDPHVAEAAYRWAVEQPQSRLGRTFDMGMELFSGVFAPGSADLGDMRERFLAHRVTALGPPESIQE